MCTVMFTRLSLCFYEFYRIALLVDRDNDKNLKLNLLKYEELEMGIIRDLKSMDLNTFSKYNDAIA